MEIIYTAYTRKINNVTTYFVKRFTGFPEFNNVAPVLDGMGMHTDFEKACAIAGISDPDIRKVLLRKLNQIPTRQRLSILKMDLSSLNGLPVYKIKNGSFSSGPAYRLQKEKLPQALTANDTVQEAIKFLSRLNSFVELETNRLFQKEATVRITLFNVLLLTELFVIILNLT